jgi:hypothetical protein
MRSNPPQENITRQKGRREARIQGGVMNFTLAERISLKLHPELNERWVQGLIAEDPTILGLGDLVLRDRERMQPRAGRLDLLLEDADADAERRYEVEVQLGPTDEAHIIRTIEYWDIERKRYPQYDHCAVLVAEDITSRFLNVISLFNGTIPLIALQMHALTVGQHTTLIFTKVMDELKRGPDDEGVPPPVADRDYWEKRGSRATVQLADELLAIAHQIDPSLKLQYNKHYIGIFKNGQPFNFCIFRPKKNTINLAIRLPRSDEIDSKLEEAAIEVLAYARYGAYRLSLQRDDIAKSRDLLKNLMRAAYEGHAA